jgi:hypothetical protein
LSANVVLFSKKSARLQKFLQITTRFLQITTRFLQITPRFLQITARFIQITLRFLQITARFAETNGERKERAGNDGAYEKARGRRFLLKKKGGNA